MRSYCLAALLCVICPPVSAHSSGECDAVPIAVERLACYDRLHPPRLVAEAKTETETEAETIKAPAVTESVTKKFVEDKFGQEQLQKKTAAKAAVVDTMAGRITEITRRARQEMVFHLDNAQVWMQVTARFRMIKVGEAVKIKRARLGGYILTTEHGVSTRVKRLR